MRSKSLDTMAPESRIHRCPGRNTYLRRATGYLRERGRIESRGAEARVYALESKQAGKTRMVYREHDQQAKARADGYRM
jgi:hypothetical protein